jgi:hypothetical protein
MASRPPSPGDDRADAALIAGFARAHGCPRGCDACERTRAQFGVPGLLSEWTDFVASRDALRAVLLSKRSGRSFPHLSNDDVVQFCIEEALHERAALHERRSQVSQFSGVQEMLGGGVDGDGGGGPPAAPTISPEHEEALSKARQFAATGREG